MFFAAFLSNVDARRESTNELQLSIALRRRRVRAFLIASRMGSPEFDGTEFTRTGDLAACDTLGGPLAHCGIALQPGIDLCDALKHEAG